MSRPRPSVLQLFDPLSTRDTHSESDKENLPDYDFFPAPHIKHPSPVRLTRRLVEVGDVTVNFDDDMDGDSVDEEDEECVKEDENDTVGPQHPASPCTPLGDVTFDRERTPMRSKMYRRKPNSTAAVIPEAAPDDFAFAPILNAVNTSGATFGRPHLAPSVVICSPDESPSSSDGDKDTPSTSLATLSLATPTGSLIADTTLAFPTPSEASTSLLVPLTQPLPISVPSSNPDRSSADLHSSFALHMDMNPAESSFDLLNDKISFLSQGDEESYYMEGELGPISKQEDTHESGESSQIATDPGIHAELASVTASPPRSGSPLPRLPEISHENIRSVDQYPHASPAIPIAPTIAPSVAPVFRAPPAKQISPPLTMSLPKSPTLVSGLKIVKRKRPDLIAESELTVLPIGTQSSADDVQSPEPPVPVPSRATRIASSTVASVVRSITEGQGPGRVPSLSNDKEKIGTTARYPKPIPGTTVSGPRRVPVVQAPPPAPPPAIPKAPSQVAQDTGLKRPLRQVPPNGSVSILPRAVGGTSNGGGSRLPMPKSRIAVAGGITTGLPRRRVP